VSFEKVARRLKMPKNLRVTKIPFDNPKISPCNFCCWEKRIVDGKLICGFDDEPKEKECVGYYWTIIK